jgi:hypothetical protein
MRPQREMLNIVACGFIDTQLNTQSVEAEIQMRVGSRIPSSNTTMRGIMDTQLK